MANSKNISIIGLGKLGSVMAGVMADAGHNVIGVDVNERFVDAINRGEAPVLEPGLEELIASNRSRLRATTDFNDAIENSEATFIIVPTPSGPDGKFVLDYVAPAIKNIGKGISQKNDYHLVTLTSTVMPGATESVVKPILESFSRRTCGPDLGLCYSPEFIALGSVVRDMKRPDMILVGQSDDKAGTMLQDISLSVVENNPIVQRMNIVNAEITKLAVNCYVTTKISYANFLAEVCERIPGADVNEVTTALGLDSRIGKKYLTGAVGYGGPCFPRDNIAFTKMVQELGLEPTMTEATHTINQRQFKRLGDLMRGVSNGNAGILGLSYKPDTPVIDESQGVMLARYLVDLGVPVTVYDPQALDNAKKALGNSVRYAGSMQEVASSSDVLAIMTPWNEFKTLRPEDLKSPSTIVDCWRIVPHLRDAADYITIGAYRG